MTEEACKICRFWRQSHRSDDGECRRYAPKPIPLKALFSHAVQWDAEMTGGNYGPKRSDQMIDWPITSAEDWCGEFQWSVMVIYQGSTHD